MIEVKSCHALIIRVICGGVGYMRVFVPANDRKTCAERNACEVVHGAPSNHMVRFAAANDFLGRGFTVSVPSFSPSPLPMPMAFEHFYNKPYFEQLGAEMTSRLRLLLF
jgi:hypothetical protein